MTVREHPSEGGTTGMMGIPVASTQPRNTAPICAICTICATAWDNHSSAAQPSRAEEKAPIITTQRIAVPTGVARKRHFLTLTYSTTNANRASNPPRCIAFIVKTCNNYKAADEEVAERIAIVENCWTRTRMQTDFIQPLGPIIDAEHNRVLDNVLRILAVKLSSAETSLKGVLAKRQKNGGELRAGFLGFAKSVRRGKYAFVKDALDGVIRDLEEWQQRFDPSWFLIMRMANPVIDNQLREAMGRQNASSQSLSVAPSQPGRPVSPNPSSSPRPRRQRSQQQLPHRTQNSFLTTGLQQTSSPLSLADGIRTALRTNGPRSSIFLPPVAFDFTPIPYSKAKAARRHGSNDRWFIVDSLVCRPGSTDAMTNDVRDLAQKLSHADPLTFGLLNCKGAMRITDPRQPSHIISFDLFLRIPDGMEIPQSLRQFFLLYPGGTGSSPSITRRVRIAQQLAKSVSYVHTFNFVHKSISPESVLLLEDVNSSRSATFLVGFDRFRSADGATSLQGDSAWYQNIYRHPSRQGESPEDTYRMQHDIYSLGVCLLEIGLWESFVEYPSDTPSPGGPIRDFVAQLTGPGRGAQRISGPSVLGFEAKEYMERLATDRLPQAMGERYSQVVQSCLTCLDRDNEDFGGDAAQQAAADPDGIHLGVRFYDVILERLNEIMI
ncbi:hypothetical protein G7Z17_g8852 [Cylindrodendrum hubeiense]|uniref:Protein kinase domain-containing protein n=1 Tax=Cylindrodendrum hubeiense TaxID=595255 RepID=A0A9P5L663_9HYPO|nr:hypothetical protein G7Z17_g8852 [Cylindrodendrum hubeiense]